MSLNRWQARGSGAHNTASVLHLQAYEDLGHSHVVNTAWAMLALMLAGYHQVDPKPLARHVQMQSKTSAAPPEQHLRHPGSHSHVTAP